MFTHRLSPFPTARLTPLLVIPHLILLVNGAPGFARLGHVEALSLEPEFPSAAVIHKVNLDKLIDKYMWNIQDTLLPVDPLDLKDVHYPLTSKIYMDLHNGWMQNLSLIKRVGACSLTYTRKVLSVEMNFGWENIAVDFRYLLKMVFLKRKGDVHVLLSNLKINVIVEIDFNYYEVKLKRLEFVDKGKIHVSLQGHLTDKIYNIMIKAVTNSVQKLVFKTIELKSSEIIQAELDKINEQLHQHHRFNFLDLAEANQAENFIIY